MILPIMAFGSPILKTKCHEINSDFKDLNILIQNMWETMYARQERKMSLGIKQLEKNKNHLLPYEDTADLDYTATTSLVSFNDLVAPIV
jgi:peptide deformylase